MSIRVEYNKYCSNGGTLTKKEYAFRLNNIKTKIGDLINSDPEDLRSDIGKRIFEYLDLSTGVAFVRVSKGLYERSQKKWIVGDVREIVLQYVRGGASYKDYFREEGWKGLVRLSAQAAGVAVTIFAGVEASSHMSNIPPDAPTRTWTTTDQNGDTHELTVPDHPEYYKAIGWAVASSVTGLATTSSMLCQGIERLLIDTPLPVFFDATEEKIIGSEETSWALKKISPDFHKWKIDKMKENLISNPRGWRDHKVLNQFVCPISCDFMLFPVKDECDHEFDYRSVVGHRLRAENPFECPILRMSTDEPNMGWVEIKFDKLKFDLIQKTLHQIKQ